MTEHRTPYQGSQWSYLDNRPESVWEGLIGSVVEIEWAGSGSGWLKYWTQARVLAADAIWVRVEFLDKDPPNRITVRLSEIEFATEIDEPLEGRGRGGQPNQRMVA